MDVLEILHGREFKKISFNVRKIEIDAPKLLLLGPRGSGKSTIIFDYLSEREKGEFLYVDCEDFRLSNIFYWEKLQPFIDMHDINLLVVENYTEQFPLPNVKEMVITSSKALKLEGFATKTLYPLDFEEYISFDKRVFNLEATFNSYAVTGTYPEMQRHQRSDFIAVFQHYLKMIAKSDTEMAMLQLLSSQQGRLISVHSLFQLFKETHKSSKDSFYNYINKMQEEMVIFLVAKFEHPRSAKKLYLIDFTIRSALSFDKDFIKRFENIVFLELLKRDKEIYYTDVVDFYLPQEDKAIMPIPFLPKNMIVSKIERLHTHFESLGIKNVQIVTMEVEGSFVQNGIVYEMLPFWQFATGL